MRPLREGLVKMVLMAVIASVLSVSMAAAETPPVFLLKWGSYGSDNGQFIHPVGVAADGSGNVYVLDRNNQRVQKFSSTGAFLTTWGSPGSGDGQFYDLIGLAVDGSGDVYVSDPGLNRVQKFTSDGTFLTKWGSEGSGDGQFEEPFGLAVDGGGNLYVADVYNYRVQKFTSEGAFLAKWGAAGSGSGQFDYPVGVAVDGSGNVYVTDFNNARVQKFTSDGTWLTTLGSSGTGDGQFGNASFVAVDGSDNVYVTDVNLNRVQKFSSTGTFLLKWGSYGSGDGQFENPYGVAIDGSGHVYVADYMLCNIQKFGPALKVNSIADIRNDQGRQVRITFTNLAPPLAASIIRYDVLRRIDPLPSPSRPTLEHRAGGATIARDLDPASVQDAGWDFVGSTPAYGVDVYNLVVPTMADSNEAGMFWSAFMIRAATSTPTVYYDSPVDSGYSVDNLPPLPPAPFTGAYMAGATHLHWGKNTESDLWYYALYRGSVADFVPGPGNLIASQADTGYADAGAAGSCYKLAAVDLNGNVSGYALLTPQQTSDVPASQPLSFALEGARPNPVHGEQLSVTFTLPKTAPAKLELVDVSGRRVVEREVGTLGAGRHAVDLAADQRLAPGLYLLRLTQGANLRVTRVAVLK